MSKQRGSKYDYLFAMNLGEEHVVDNLPTPAEARRKANPSERLAVKRINSAISSLKKVRPEYRFTHRVFTSPGSRIEGNKISIRLVAIGEATDDQEFEAWEARSNRAREAWKKRKIAEDAPKLPAQLEEANAGELARRVAGAVKRQIAADIPKYDPKKLAELVAYHTTGGVIQQLRTNDGVWIDDPNPTWTLPTAHYRKKPIRREFYIIMARDGSITTAADSPDRLPHHDPACLIHAREVLPEEE